MVLPVTLNDPQVAAVQEPHCLYSFIDRTGHELFADQFREAKDFAEGVAPVGDGTHWGYVDRHGKLVIPMQYSDAEPFAEGLAAVQIRGKWGYADHAGKWLSLPPLHMPSTFPKA